MIKEEDRRLIERIWRRVPVKVRRRYWEETDYGKRAPSEPLKAVLIAAATASTVDACAVVMAANAEVKAVDAEMTDLAEVVARLPALVKIRRDLEYRLPENGQPLAHITLTREQAIELLSHCAKMTK
jgi:hypothetical protein